METVLPWSVPNNFFDEAIHQTVGDIFSLWTPDTPFYIVLDEANVITRGTYCFLRAFEGNPILNETLFTMGRFIDKDMQQIVVPDKLICLVVGARRFLGENISISDVDFHLSSEPRFQNRFSATSLMALCLTHVFSEPRSLADLFVFPGTKPEWAAQMANLVSLDAQPFYYTPGTFKCLAHVSKSREGILAWLKHEHKTVFRISSIDSSAPVLLFALKLADGSPIWVFLSVSLDGTTEEPLAESEVRDAFANLQPERVLCESEVEPSPESDAPPGGSDVNATTAEEMHANDLGPAVESLHALDPIPAAAAPKAATLSLPSDVRELLDALPKRRVDVGKHSILRVLASLRADPQLDQISPDSSLASLNVQYESEYHENDVSEGSFGGCCSKCYEPQ